MMSLRSSNYFNRILILVFVFHSTLDVGRSMFDVHLFKNISFEKELMQILGLIRFTALLATPVRTDHADTAFIDTKFAMLPL